MHGINHIFARNNNMFRRENEGRAADGLVGGILGSTKESSSTPTDGLNIGVVPASFGSLIPSLPAVSGGLLDPGNILPTLPNLLSSSTKSQPPTSTSKDTRSSTTSSSTASSTGSSTSTSTSSSTSASSTQAVSSPSDTQAQASQTAPPTLTPQIATNTVTSTTPPSASPSATGAIAASNAGGSFMQNKPLSISIITLSSLVALVFCITIATWALRKRRRNKLETSAAELSTDSLVGNRRGDVEKNSFGSDVLDKVVAVGGARSEGSIYGVGRSGSGGSKGSNGSSRGGASMRGPTRADAYGQPGYTLPPMVASGQNQYPQQGYGRNMAPPEYNQPRGYAPPPGYDQRQAYAQTGSLYYDNRDYAEAAQYNQGQAYAGQESGAQLPNPFENPETMFAMAPEYDLIVRASSPRQEFLSPPRTVQRKLPLPMLSLDIAPDAQAPPQELNSAISLTASPLQVVSGVNPGNPMTPTNMLESPQVITPKRSSLLNSPHTPTTPNSSVPSPNTAKTLDHILPQIPVAPPLPDEFGTSLPSAKSIKQSRSLKVVNT